MRNFFLFLCTLFFLGCSAPEPDEFEFTVRFFNMSAEPVTVEGYDPFNSQQFSFNINPEERDGEISYFGEQFYGYARRSDSIVVKFSDNTGYICALRGNGNLFCFRNRNPLLGSEEDFRDLGNNSYEFVISQEDFDNAFDLPL